MDSTSTIVSGSETPHERTLFGSNNCQVEAELFGSGSFKHDRYGNTNSTNGEETEDGGQQWRFSKLSRTDSLPRSSVYSHGEGQMLSFSSPNTNNTHGSFHSYHYAPTNHHPCFRNEGGMNVNMQEGRLRGPFTPSQWMELEHQALIYKYLAANAPIPHSLLLPLRRSLLSSPSLHPFSPHFFNGWGAQMGYSLSLASGAGDAEPGRCRRTDGKKWRCSRDAVPDQKYCERHINRGRHRSRKHVEPHKPVKSNTCPATSAPPAEVAADVTAMSALHYKSTTNLWNVNGDRDNESLSLLTPMLPFSSSSSSSNNNNNNNNNNTNNNMFEPYQQRYQSWPELHDERTELSISIPNSMGGPLGEVLTKKSNGSLGNRGDSSGKGGFNLLTGLGWDLDSDPQPEASPTGVLQKTGFGSLSSSAGSSPRLESYKAHDDLGSILVNHLSNLSSV